MYLDFNNEIIEQILRNGEFGLEKESLRVTGDGHLATTAHPFGDDRHITRDFCESQLEFVTGIHNSSAEVCTELYRIQNKANKILHHLTKPEYIWPSSNPPYVDSDNEIRIAHFADQYQDKEIYREYLACKYGKRKMLLSGIHFNYSTPDSILLEAYRSVDESVNLEQDKSASGTGNNSSDSLTMDSEEYKNFKNNLYLGTAYRLMGLSWMIVYTMSASPLLDASFVGGKKGESLPTEYNSIRCGEEGYYNNFDVDLRYDSLRSYVNSIKRMINHGDLYSISELYYPIRLKPKGDNTLDNLSRGINHLELRMLDLNPYSDIGIYEEDVDFLQILITYCMSKESVGYIARLYKTTPNEQGMFLERDYDTRALQRIKAAALNECKEYDFKTDATGLLDELANFCILHNNQEALPIIDGMMMKILDPNIRYADRIIKEYGDKFVEKTLEQIKA